MAFRSRELLRLWSTRTSSETTARIPFRSDVPTSTCVPWRKRSHTVGEADTTAALRKTTAAEPSLVAPEERGVARASYANSSGSFVGGCGVRPLSWKFGMCFAHGRALCLLVGPCSSPGQWRTPESSPGQRPRHLPSPAQRAGYPSTQTHKRAKGPAVCAGSSIPNVSFVHLNAVLLAEPPVFVLERTRRVVLFLTPNGFVHFALH